jgi:neutral amino acid transport system permease protein
MVNTGLENAILNGIITGSFIALGAIGLSLVYNIADVPNFAHGELLMIGAYFALLVNVPQDVPLLESLTSASGEITVPVMAVLFVLTAGAAIGTVVLIGGLSALEGGWWPIDPPAPGVAIAVHALAAAALGLFVAIVAPSIWGGFVLSGLLLAFVGPLFDKFVFSKFREEDAALAIILMATMGLAFVLRFTMQAIFGGTIRSYDVDRILSIGGASVDLTRAKFLDVYVTGEGLVVELIDTAPSPHETTFLAGTPWLVFDAVVLVTIGAGYGSYRWRGAGIGEHEAVQTIGPRIVGSVAAVVAFVAAFLVLASPMEAPDAATAIYASRIRTSIIRLSVVVVAVVLMVSLHVLLKETKLGKAMRASSDNLDLAKVTGINTDRVMMVT